MKVGELVTHRYLRVRRTWIDVTTCASRRAGILFYRPGRMIMRGVVRVLSWLAVFPWRGRCRLDDLLPGFELENNLATITKERRISYVTAYVGNGSARSKWTLLVRFNDGSEVVVKAAETEGGVAAIRQEVMGLRRVSSLVDQVPKLLGEGKQGKWGWSVQSVLPKGESPNRLQAEHYAFLEELRKLGVSHGDFTPWNCSIVDGRLVVWDWEESGDWIEGQDARWFRDQVKKLLGIEDDARSRR